MERGWAYGPFASMLSACKCMALWDVVLHKDGPFGAAFLLVSHSHSKGHVDRGVDWASCTQPYGWWLCLSVQD